MHDEYFVEGKPVQRLSYCAFLDVLGFKERVLRSDEAGQSDLLFSSFHSIFSSSLTAIKNDCETSTLRAKSFSDNVLIASPAISPDLEFEFAIIMWTLREYQMKMALNGLFIRGGLSIGPLFVGPDNVYGRALIESYELESSVAVHPIVVLSNDAMDCVDRHIKFYNGEFAPQLRDVLVNSEGRYFINYLVECIAEDDEGEILDGKLLKEHKDQIDAAMKQSVGNDRVHSKYIWLACYHNYFCDSVAHLYDYDASLRIDDAAQNALIRRIDS